MADKTIKGLTKVLKDLEKFGKEGKIEIDTITKVTSMDIVADAKSFAPKDFGKLAQSIIYTKVEDSSYKVVVNAPYGAYVEFGTGKSVRVPTELKEIAIQFKGKGVKNINLQPQPYLYPAFVKGRKQYLKDLEKSLKDLTKKHG
tara:strand:+ start:263 stop:694 length:432 start_codon:yes stop_codon:yes gene_type:complete